MSCTYNCVNMKDQTFHCLLKAQVFVRRSHLPLWFHVYNGKANWKWVLGYFSGVLCTFNSPHSDFPFYYSPEKYV